MKLCTAIVAVCLLGAAHGFKCPRDANDDCIDGNFPDPVDCGKFFMCAHCTPRHMDCPASLHFSPKHNACVWPHEANCVVSTTTLSPTTPTTPVPPKIDADAFFVGRTRSNQGKTDPVLFDHIITNVRGSFDMTSGTFTAKYGGIYFTSFSAGATVGGRVDYGLTINKDRVSDIYRTTRITNDVDTLTKDAMVEVKAGDTLSMNSLEASGIYSDDRLLTSFSAFRLTDMMKTNVVFSVANKLSACACCTPVVEFDNIKINIGNGFNPADYAFHVPVTGTYFISFGMGTRRYSLATISLRKNNVYIANMNKLSFNFNGIDTYSRGLLVELKAGDIVKCHLENPSFLYTDYGEQIQMSGFLYDPKHGPRVAWTVGRSKPLTVNAPITPVPYDLVIINEGTAWQAATNTVKIPAAGVYYLTFSAGTLGKTALKLALLKNGNAMAEVVRASTAHEDTDFTGRSLILALQAGDELSISAGRNTGMFSDPAYATAFSGFLIFGYDKTMQV